MRAPEVRGLPKGDVAKMILKHGYEEEREIVIRFVCNDRMTARAEIGLLERSLLPPGYVMDKEVIDKTQRDPRKGGARVNVIVVLFHNDSRHPPADFEGLERTLRVLNAR